MIISKYLTEIKIRFFLLNITSFTTLIATYTYKETLLFLLLQPQNLYEDNLTTKNNSYFIFTDVLEIFSTYYQLLLFITKQVLFIYLSYHLFLFFSPALYKKEYLKINYLIKTFFLMNMLFTIILVQLIFPLSWNFFLSFKFLNFINLNFEAKLSECLDFFITIYYSTFLYCQIFCLLLVIFKYFSTNIVHFRKLRKLYYFIMILLSTMICPPDAFYQCIITSFLCFTYEFIVLVSLYPVFLKT